jgi:hypothetical protein
MAFELNSFHIAVDGYLSPHSISKFATFGEVEFDVPTDTYIPNVAEMALKLLVEQFKAGTIF